MRRILLTLIITSAFAVVGRSQVTLDLKGAEAIRKMDIQWIIEAYSSKDLKDFDRIVADDAFFTGADGKVLSKSDKRARLKADYSADPAQGGIFKIDEQSHEGRFFGDTAVSKGFIVENYTWKAQKIHGHVHFTDTYVKRDGKWQLVASHFTNIKQSQ